MEKKYATGMLRADGRPGFVTPTGKCEIWSTRLEKFGYEPLPYYLDKYPSMEVLKEYPLILTDGRKLEIYHGLGLTLPSRRRRVPDPVIEIHPDTAKKFGLDKDDWVWVQTHQNRNRFKRKVVLSSDLDPKVVWCNSHFHFPEKENIMERLEPNINLSHTLEGPLDPIDGAGIIRGVPCRIDRE
jgi:anaerobic selenocysteine-containing dehydrogenase